MANEDGSINGTVVQPGAFTGGTRSDSGGGYKHSVFMTDTAGMSALMLEIAGIFRAQYPVLAGSDVEAGESQLRFVREAEEEAACLAEEWETYGTETDTRYSDLNARAREADGDSARRKNYGQ